MNHEARQVSVRRLAGAVVGILVLTVWFSSAPRQARGQEYETKSPVELDSRTEAGIKAKVAKALRGEEDNNAVLDNWFGRVVFPRMTQLNQLDKLPELRRDFLDYIDRYYSRDNERSRKAHDHVVNLALKEMNEIAKGRFHPAVRYNAMMLIGELNEKEAVRTAGEPAEPLPAALIPMGQALSEPTQIDAVRVAALLGILRHMERESERPIEQRVIEGSTKTGLISMMLKIIDGTLPPGERSPEGQLWMKRRAVNILGALGDVGTESVSVVGKLESILADEKANMLLRCDAAVALGRIRFPNGTADAAKYATMLATLADHAARDELRRLQRHKQMIDDVRAAAAESKSSPTRPGGGNPFGAGVPFDTAPPYDDGGDSFGGDPADGGDPLDEGDPLAGGDPLDGGDPSDGGDTGDFGGGYNSVVGNPVDVAFRENYKVDLARRRLAFYLECALRGMTGPYDPSSNVRPPNPDVVPEWLRKPGSILPGVIYLPSAASGPNKQRVDAILEKIKKLLDIVVAQKPGETKDPEGELQRLIDDINSATTELDTAAGIKKPTPAVVPPAVVPPVGPTGDEPTGDTPLPEAPPTGGSSPAPASPLDPAPPVEPADPSPVPPIGAP